MIWYRHLLHDSVKALLRSAFAQTKDRSETAFVIVIAGENFPHHTPELSHVLCCRLQKQIRQV